MDQTMAAPVGIMLLLFVMGFLFLALLIPKIFYLISLQKALNQCQPHNRLMQPGLVWLMLIPFLDLIWHFFIVVNMAGSLEKEFNERGIVSEPEPGKAVGFAMCICNACSLIPYVNSVSWMAALICWIVYWVKIAECSRILQFQPLETAPGAE